MDNPTPAHMRPYVVTNQEWADLIKRQQEVDDAVFGGWDPKMKKRSPGVLERLDGMTWILRGIAAFTLVSTLRAFGVPTQEVLPVLLKLIAATSGS
jgi:hypothetical protein